MPGAQRSAEASEPTGTTDGPGGEAAGFTATCAGAGRLQTGGSTQGTDHETQDAQRESVGCAVVMIRPEDGGEPSAELRLQHPGGDSEDLPGRVGETAEFDDWALMIRSICPESAGFDVEMRG